jgi:predicted nucleic acid-binding protein
MPIRLPAPACHMTTHAFLDSTILVRHITQDNPEQAQRARALLQAADDSALLLATCEAAIVETIQILESKALYNVPRAEVLAYLAAVLSIPGLRLANRQAYLRALDLYASSPRLSFVDALQVAHMERLGISTIATFDHGFESVPGITRHEP